MEEKIIKAFEETSENIKSAEKNLAMKFKSILAPLAKILRFIDAKIVTDTKLCEYDEDNGFERYYRQNGLLIYKMAQLLNFERKKDVETVFSNSNHTEENSETTETELKEIYILRDGSLVLFTRIKKEYAIESLGIVEKEEYLINRSEISVEDLLNLDDYIEIEKEFLKNCKRAIEIAVLQNPKKKQILQKVIDFFNNEYEL
jgi:hypothetical protein